jgi:hypothetical protein
VLGLGENQLNDFAVEHLYGMCDALPYIEMLDLSHSLFFDSQKLVRLNNKLQFDSKRNGKFRMKCINVKYQEVDE